MNEVMKISFFSKGVYTKDKYQFQLTQGLNVFVALVDVVIWKDGNLINNTADIGTVLVDFLRYRREFLINDHPNDFAILLVAAGFNETTTNSTNSNSTAVGDSYLGQICSIFTSGAVVSLQTSIARTASTMAHELGHSFGIHHDTINCYCPEALCLMWPLKYVATAKWSSCSIEEKLQKFNHGFDECLKNKPRQLFRSSYCGNGFVEQGEDCDCGSPEHCENKCCDPYTCKRNILSNATCSSGKCCDFSTCKTFKAGKVCRESVGECDLAESCDGDSEFCPVDVFVRDTEECQGGEAFCFHGSCRTHDNQCEFLMGAGATSSTSCYNKNNAGITFDPANNCGRNFSSSNRFISCKSRDILCGRLHCRNINNGIAGSGYKTYSFTFEYEKLVACKSTSFHHASNVRDPGLVPDGAKCGDEKMCLNQECVAIDDLRNDGKITECPGCNRNGVCNSNGHCHCFEGWGGRTCLEPAGKF